jgi:hypothetical protein
VLTGCPPHRDGECGAMRTIDSSTTSSTTALPQRRHGPPPRLHTRRPATTNTAEADTVDKPSVTEKQGKHNAAGALRPAQGHCNGKRVRTQSVCVCVCERERERETDTDRHGQTQTRTDRHRHNTDTHTHHMHSQTTGRRAKATSDLTFRVSASTRTPAGYPHAAPPRTRCCRARQYL